MLKYHPLKQLKYVISFLIIKPNIPEVNMVFGALLITY